MLLQKTFLYSPFKILFHIINNTSTKRFISETFSICLSSNYFLMVFIICFHNQILFYISIFKNRKFYLSCYIGELHMQTCERTFACCCTLPILVDILLLANQLQYGPNSSLSMCCFNNCDPIKRWIQMFLLSFQRLTTWPGFFRLSQSEMLHLNYGTPDIFQLTMCFL